MTRNPAKYVGHGIVFQFSVFLTLFWYAMDTLLTVMYQIFARISWRELTSQREEPAPMEMGNNSYEQACLRALE